MKNFLDSNVRLRDFIRNIRSCKTAADERTVISKECASIRTAFKDEDVVYRTRNVAKVLYIHMLGYPAHFGQLEVLKLVSSPKFLDKRLGYLGAMMLLDERTDIQLLLTNCLKLDLNSRSQYICCTALCTLGNICSAEMAKDLAPEVEKLLKSSNPLIKKKAALVACRIVRKEPDLMENYLPVIRNLLNERNHGVLLTGVTLLIEMCIVSNEAVEYSRRMVPQLVRILKTLVNSGPTQDHDVGGVTDPFLQVKILRLLGILGRGDDEASDAMNDILAQVATNTESNKNAGNAILYESVRTIMKIKDEVGLRVFAINILGRFLQDNDKNIRYVALNTLLRCVNEEMQAVQRHRDTIVDCLNDMDISIRRRALELTFALMNHSNIRALTREIFLFLENCDTEFKTYICNQVARTSAKFAPNKRWQVDTIMKTLTLAGSHTSDELVDNHIHTFAQMEELHSYIVRVLYTALQNDISAQPLVKIGIWLIGEFGELLFDKSVQEEGLAEDLTEEEVIDLLETVLVSTFTSKSTKQYVLTCLLKLSTRFTKETNRIHTIIYFYGTSTSIELQQRAVEYDKIMGKDNTGLKDGLLERMPIKEITAQDEVYNYNDQYSDTAERRRSISGKGVTKSKGKETSVGKSGASGASGSVSGSTDLLDLLNTDVIPSFISPGGGMDDLLGALGGLGLGSADATSKQPSVGGAGDILGLFDGDSNNNNNKKDTVYSNNNIVINFTYEPSGNANVALITVTCSNNNRSFADNFVFQAAVPKTLKLMMLPASSSSIPPNGNVTQKMKIANPAKTPFKLRLRVCYDLNGKNIQDQVDSENLNPIYG